MTALYLFLKPIKDIAFILTLLCCICTRITLQYLIPNTASNNNLIDLGFHLFIGLILWLFFIKKYHADVVRIGLLGFFLLEFTIGIFLKKMQLSYGAEITTIGLIGILIVWLNTHSNRSKFD